MDYDKTMIRLFNISVYFLTQIFHQNYGNVWEFSLKAVLLFK